MVLEIGVVEKFGGSDYRLRIKDFSSQIMYEETGLYTTISQLTARMNSLKTSYRSNLTKLVMERIEQ